MSTGRGSVAVAAPADTLAVSVSSEGVSALGAYLVEMDQMLRDVQLELEPDREPAQVREIAAGVPRPPRPGPPPPPLDPAIAATRDLRTITELSGSLLASTRALLDGYERVLMGGWSTPAGAPSRAAPPSRPRSDPDAARVALSAGPFVSIEALREFERAVEHLPGVREVSVRAYKGADGAIIDVRLDPAST